MADSGTVACIDVGSGALKMVVAKNKDGRAKIIDVLHKRTSLGRDCYAHGRISFQTIAETCETLAGFKRVLSEYGNPSCMVVATSAIREAANRDFILDQIRIRTGLKVDVMDNAQERFTTYAALNDVMLNYQDISAAGLLVVDIGYGSIQVSVIRKGRLTYSRNILLGALRLWEILSNVGQSNAGFADMIEEYIIANTDILRTNVRMKDIKHYIVISGEAEWMNKLGGGFLDKERFIALYKRIKNMAPDQVEYQYGISQYHFEIILPSLLVVKAFLDITRPQQLYMPELSLAEAMVYQRAHEKDAGYRRARELDIITSARALASTWQSDKRHSAFVESAAMAAFDDLRQMHGMGDKQKLLLRLACILHDIGKTVSSTSHGQQAAAIIQAAQLMGLSQVELNTVAFCCRYHVGPPPVYGEDEFFGMNKTQRVAASKILAILRLCYSLNGSRKQKINEINFSLAPAHVMVSVKTSMDIALEKWMFLNVKDFFADVFGIKAELHVEKLMK